MVQVFRREHKFEGDKPVNHYVPIEETVVALLTSEEEPAKIMRLDGSRLGELVGLNQPIELVSRCLGGDERGYFHISTTLKKIYPGERDFRHQDKVDCFGTFYIKPEVTVDEILAEFQEAGYKLLDRQRTWEEPL